MNVYHYKTPGGKDLILDYILSLSNPEIIDGLSVLERFEKNDSEKVISRAKELGERLSKRII
jgi:hypothetical protein